MCLILFAYRSHPAYSLILASNRDEFLDRPTARIHRWDIGSIHAGKDLKAGGTWMGVTSRARWAALTNFRDGLAVNEQAPSRGDLVIDYLTSDITGFAYAQQLQQKGAVYNPYNILLGEKEKVIYQSNQDKQPRSLEPGIYGLSNHLLNTPWPKVERGKKALNEIAASEEIDINRLFSMLQHKELAADEKLPDTGIPYEWEKRLSAMFIEMKGYGTRVSTVLLQDYEGNVFIEERAYQPVGKPVNFHVSMTAEG